MALLDPYIVGVDGPWALAEASHLLRRAGFGGSPEDRQAAVGAGDQAALTTLVDALVNYAPQDPFLDQPAGTGTGVYGDPLADLPNDSSDLGRLKSGKGQRDLQAHWLYRMRYSSQPLQEQFTLFLHDHFASEWRKLVRAVSRPVNFGNDGTHPNAGCSTGTLPPDPERQDRFVYALMRRQNYLYRESGAEHSFREFLIEVTRDPAMLAYLDNMLNLSGRPQENYARELMELFTMGEGNYSEQDVREIAKCLTGETLPLRNCVDDYHYEVYAFDPIIHELGEKSVFGQNVLANIIGQETVDVIDLILAKISVSPNVLTLNPPYTTLSAAAVYMSWKLIRWFVNESALLSPPDPEVLELADYMRGTDNAVYPQRRFTYDFKACLRKLLLSKYFHNPANRLIMAKRPADLILHTLRALDLWENYTEYGGPAARAGEMGMELFNPPNVSGWNSGEAWLASGYLLERINYGYRVAEVLLKRTDWDAEINAFMNGLLAANGGPLLTDVDFDGMITHFAEVLLHADVTAAQRGELVEFLSGMPPHGDAQTRYRTRVRGTIQLIMALPQFQYK